MAMAAVSDRRYSDTSSHVDMRTYRDLHRTFSCVQLKNLMAAAGASSSPTPEMTTHTLSRSFSAMSLGAHRPATPEANGEDVRRSADIAHEVACAVFSFPLSEKLLSLLPFFNIAPPSTENPDDDYCEELSKCIQTILFSFTNSSCLNPEERALALSLSIESVLQNQKTLLEVFEMAYDLSLVAPFQSGKTRGPYLDPSKSLHERAEILREWIKIGGVLEEIEGRNCSMTCIPEEFLSLRGLRALQLDNNLIMAIPDSVGSARDLHTLSLGKNLIQTVPDTIGNLASLLSLCLNFNKLSSLPDALCSCSALRDLHLFDNVIESLPARIGDLSLLELLVLGKNRLSSIPSSVVRLTRLKTLSAQENMLSSLPQGFGDLRSLRRLTLSNNRFQEITKEIGRLICLETFHVSGNKLTSLPVQIGGLSCLKEVWVEGNLLVSIPESLLELRRLEVLNLENNLIWAVPDDTVLPPSLKSLSLGGNRLETFPEAVCKLPSLEILSLGGNFFIPFSSGLGKLTNLRQLSLCVGNPLESPLSSEQRKWLRSHLPALQHLQA